MNDYGSLVKNCDDNFLLSDIIDNLPSMPDDLQKYVKWNFNEIDQKIYSGSKIRSVHKYCTVTKYFPADMEIRRLNDDSISDANYQTTYGSLMYEVDKMNDEKLFEHIPECYSQLKLIINAPSYDNEHLYELEKNCDRLLKWLSDRQLDDVCYRVAKLLTKSIMPWKALGHDVFNIVQWRGDNGFDSSIDNMYLLYNLSYGLGKITKFDRLSIADENDIGILVANYFHILGHDDTPCTNRFVCAIPAHLRSRELIDTIIHCCKSVDTVGLLSNLVYPEKYSIELSHSEKMTSNIDTINGYSIIQHMDNPRHFNKDALFEITSNLRMINEDEVSAYFTDNICGRDITFALSANDVGNIRKNTKLGLIATVDMLNNMATKYLAVTEDGQDVYLLFNLKFGTSTPIYGINVKRLPDGSRKIMSIQKSYVNTFIHKSGL